MNFLSFPDIEGLHNVIKAVNAYPHLAPGEITYRGKIKLHGTNAGIRLSNGQVHAQSRTQLIDGNNDNAGFAKWVESNRDYWINIWKNNSVGKSDNGQPPDMTIFGEWCGPGIMKGTAINQIPNKIFAVFAVMIGETLDTSIMITQPVEIALLLNEVSRIAHSRPSDIYVLPYFGSENHEAKTFVVNYGDRGNLEKIAAEINKIIEEIEPCDPWVKHQFGVEGVCEGIVFFPIKIGNIEQITRKQYSDLCFKAKGEKHKVNQNKEKKAVVIDPTVAANVVEFTQLFATEARFEQALSVVGSSEMKNMGPFLKWVAQDVLKESKVELEASALEWTQVDKSIQSAARNWFIAKNKTISV